MCREAKRGVVILGSGRDDRCVGALDAAATMEGWKGQHPDFSEWSADSGVVDCGLLPPVRYARSCCGRAAYDSPRHIVCYVLCKSAELGDSSKLEQSPSVMSGSQNSET